MRYDLSSLVADPEAGHPPGEVVFDHRVFVRRGDGPGGMRTFYGHSGLAHHRGWLYVAYRTSGVIVRLRLDERHRPRTPTVVELVARFDPYDPRTGESADVTDIGFDDRGRLYAVSAKPARVYRFVPDPAAPFDARSGVPDPAAPWADLAALTGNRRMKSENLLYHDGWLYVTSGDGYGYQQGAEGTVYRLRVRD